jgi:mRNA interferase YafQ
MKLAWHSSFRRAFKRCTRNQPELQEKIFQTLDRLAADPFQPVLKTHKLSGRLQDLWACSVEYDCRIIFAFTKYPQTDEEIIALINIGSHDEVY